MWDSVFSDQHFRLDPDYTQHAGGHGRWEDGAADWVCLVKTELLGRQVGRTEQGGSFSCWSALCVRAQTVLQIFEGFSAARYSRPQATLLLRCLCI